MGAGLKKQGGWERGSVRMEGPGATPTPPQSSPTNETEQEGTSWDLAENCWLRVCGSTHISGSWRQRREELWFLLDLDNNLNRVSVFYDVCTVTLPDDPFLRMPPLLNRAQTVI